MLQSNAIYFKRKTNSLDREYCLCTEQFLLCSTCNACKINYRSTQVFSCLSLQCLCCRPFYNFMNKYDKLKINLNRNARNADIYCCWLYCHASDRCVCISFPYFVRNSFDFDIPDKGNGPMDFTDKVERTLCKMRQCWINVDLCKRTTWSATYCT